MFFIKIFAYLLSNIICIGSFVSDFFAAQVSAETGGKIIWTFFISLMVAWTIANLCYNIAESKGLNKLGYGFFGFFLPIPAIIVIFLVKSKIVEQK